MTDREKIIKNYIDGYNEFDIDKMVIDFDENITFENIQNDEVNMSLIGLTEFRHQAEQAKAFFSQRKQVIKKINHFDNHSEIEITYNAVLATDFPNGLRKGQELNLSGKSIFEFNDNIIVKLTDIN